MTKYKAPKNPVKTREAMPLTRKTKKGTEILCPFCTPPHPIIPTQPTPCGTEIQIKAVQYMITRHTAKQRGITCMKCHKDVAGDLVACQNGFIHTFDCAPGTVILSQEPKYNKMAARVFKMPPKVRKAIEKKMGEVKEIAEVDVNGKPTGKILGYFFYKNDV